MFQAASVARGFLGSLPPPTELVQWSGEFIIYPLYFLTTGLLARVLLALVAVV